MLLETGDGREVRHLVPICSDNNLALFSFFFWYWKASRVIPCKVLLTAKGNTVSRGLPVVTY